jgi:hypothetical protein
MLKRVADMILSFPYYLGTRFGQFLPVKQMKGAEDFRAD